MGIGRTRFKVEALVEGACLLIFGMHKHCSDTGDLCGLGNPLQRLLEQSLADTLTLLSFIHSESGQDDDRDRVRASPLLTRSGVSSCATPPTLRL
jgi:hypothetical protein